MCKSNAYYLEPEGGITHLVDGSFGGRVTIAALLRLDCGEKLATSLAEEDLSRCGSLEARRLCEFFVIDLSKQ